MTEQATIDRLMRIRKKARNLRAQLDRLPEDQAFGWLKQQVGELEEGVLDLVLSEISRGFPGPPGPPEEPFAEKSPEPMIVSFGAIVLLMALFFLLAPDISFSLPCLITLCVGVIVAVFAASYHLKMNRFGQCVASVIVAIAAAVIVSPFCKEIEVGINLIKGIDPIVAPVPIVVFVVVLRVLMKYGFLDFPENGDSNKGIWRR